MSAVAAKRYAQAFFEFATEQKKVDVVYEEFNIIRQVLELAPELMVFLNNPSVSGAERQQLLKKVFEKKIENLTYTFLLFLEEKERLNILDEICVVFEDYYFKANSITRAHIATRFELKPQQKNDILHHLKLKLRKEVRSETAVDEKMIGGLKVNVEGVVYDYSFRTQLDQFRDNVLKEG